MFEIQLRDMKEKRVTQNVMIGWWSMYILLPFFDADLDAAE